MTEVRWDRLKELVNDALQLPSAERARFLDDACADDPTLRSEVDELLGVDVGIGDSFLNSSPIEGVLDVGLQEGEVVAERYRLIRKLGEGGMGQVWLAEQTAPVRRSVALKLIKAGMYDESVVQRFRSERQSLAIMDHPCIAKVFDAGATPQGQPFFVMEYVPGVPITEYCDTHKLSIQERLALFIQACEGVQHAHQKAIIHRDLKPANILVVEIDGKPVPRIIDFGLAKQIRLETERPDETMLTRFGQFMGTPGYISPEQVDPDIHDIDTRTDLYSLGVILYVLLTGLQPFENQRRQRLPLDEWVRTLREEDPPAPGSKIAAFHEHAVVAAAARGTTRLALSKMLRGDLDCITQKALHRDRESRYSSPIELAADLKRHLNDEPITARPASTGYQLRKFIQRHRGLAATFAALLLFSAVAIVAGVIAVKQRNLAVKEETAADRTSRFMVSLFELADPGENRGNSVTVREVLDRGAAEVQTSLGNEPSIRADLLTAMGQAYYGLGLYGPAKQLLEKARTDQNRVVVPPESRVRTLVATGTALYLAADYVSAEATLRDAVNLARQRLNAKDVVRSEAFDELAEVLVQQEKYLEAEALCEESLVADRERGPEEQGQLARTLDTLGKTYFFRNDLPAAEKTWREALRVHQQADGVRHALTAQAMNNLGIAIYQSGRSEDAAALFREALPVYRQVYGAEHPELAILLDNLGLALLMTGHIQDAEPLFRQALAMQEHFEGEMHDDLVSPLSMLAAIDGYNGNLPRARAEIEHAEKIARLPDHGVLLNEVLLNAADLALRSGQDDLASTTLSESRRLLETAYPISKYPGEAWRYALWDTVNAELLAHRGDQQAASQLVQSALPIIVARFHESGFYALLARRRAQVAGLALSPETRAEL